jgi:hypothetical protein
LSGEDWPLVPALEGPSRLANVEEPPQKSALREFGKALYNPVPFIHPQEVLGLPYLPQRLIALEEPDATAFDRIGWRQMQFHRCPEKSRVQEKLPPALRGTVR